MRKLFLVLLGLIMFAGAATVFAYRWVGTSWVASRSASPQPGARSAAPQAAPDRRVTRDRNSGQAFATFEILLNIANLLVGVVGIWLAISGMRMQRVQASIVRTDRH